jgi:hypothetical protein
MTHPPPVHAIAIATALFLPGLAILFARTVRGTGPSRARRILLPAIFAVLATFLVCILPLLFLREPIVGPAAMAGSLIWLAFPALLSACVAEGIVFALDAERTRHWLAAGIAAAILAVYGWLAVLIGSAMFRAEPLVIVPALVAVATAIIWWPYLPRPEGAEEDDAESAEVFE